MQEFAHTVNRSLYRVLRSDKFYTQGLLSKIPAGLVTLHQHIGRNNLSEVKNNSQYLTVDQAIIRMWINARRWSNQNIRIIHIGIEDHPASDFAEKMCCGILVVCGNQHLPFTIIE